MTIHDLTLEQMKEIVDGAPDECAYYSLVNNIVIYYQWCEEWFWHNPNTNEYERDFSKSMKFSLNDLRTAIAQHDEGQNVMDKPKTYNEWHSSLKDFEGLRHANCCKISYEAGQILLNTWKSFIQEQEFCGKPHKDTKRIEAMTNALEQALRGDDVINVTR